MEENQLGQYIPLHYHYQMLLDKQRMTGFKEAISAVVPDNGKVVELGGGTGVLSFFAAQKASKVWCVEQNHQLVEASKHYLALNGVSSRVEVIEADASTFVPPEPVDVVICEMLHSALLREKQIAVIDSFKKHYLARFPGKLPIFVPEATILAVQPVQQDFTFYGYKAPLPIFYQPTIEHVETAGLGDPVLYSVIEYKKDLPLKYSCNAEITINPAGILNGFRFITKNILAILIDKNATIDWHNFYLIVPLKDPVRVNAGDRFKLEFSYEAGGSIDSLTDSLRITNLRLRKPESEAARLSV